LEGLTKKEENPLSSLLPALGKEGLDPALLMKLSKAMVGLRSKPDDRCTLLTALKPYLREGRRGRVDEAIRLLQLWRLAELFRE
jgi:hypothetical protein